MFEKTPLYEEEIYDDAPSWKEKIMDKLQDAKHFPTLAGEWVKNNILGSVKLWGTLIMIYIVYTLWSSGSFLGLYYTWKISSERNAIIRTESYILSHEKTLSAQRQMLSCLENQMDRIVQGKNVDIGYCKK